MFLDAYGFVYRSSSTLIDHARFLCDGEWFQADTCSDRPRSAHFLCRATMTEHDSIQRDKRFCFSLAHYSVVSLSRCREQDAQAMSAHGGISAKTWHSIDAPRNAMVAAGIVIVMHMLPSGPHRDNFMVAKI
jgi:hypothetical protein